MDACAAGSLAVVCRIAGILREFSDVESCERVVSHLMSAMACDAATVGAVVDALLCRVRTPTNDERRETKNDEKPATTNVPSARVPTATTNVPSARVPTATTNVPSARIPTASLSDGLSAAAALRMGECVDASRWTAEEWAAVKHFAAGDSEGFVGGAFALGALLRVLGTEAMESFEATGDVDAAIDAACRGGSPTFTREASLVEWPSSDDEEPPKGADKTEGRRECRYGRACYQTSRRHRREFWHPPLDADEAPSRGGTTPVSVGKQAMGPPKSQSLPQPAPSPAKSPPPHANKSPPPPATTPLMSTAIPLHGVVTTTGGYRMRNCGGGVYACDCPAWRFQQGPPSHRTCKHLRTALGDDAETRRCAEAPAPPPAGVRHTPPGVLLAQTAGAGDYAGWWASEKLDGVRAVWNGRELLSRNGNVFFAPEWFTRALPTDATLDGELWKGRGKFQEAVGVVKSGPTHEGWKAMEYHIFDVPSLQSPFEARVAFLEQKIKGVAPHVVIVAHKKVASWVEVEQELQRISNLGGEGVMLRQPQSMYVASRSATLVKVKRFQECDAIVRGYDPGKGKHVGCVGALRVENAKGVGFAVGSGLSDAQRRNPPSIGSIIVVKYQELTMGGVPRFPVFLGERHDISWPPPE